MTRRQKTDASHEEVDRTKTLDQIIQQHITQRAEDNQQGSPVAAIAASDRLAWANQAGVEIDLVEERLYSVCEKVEPEQKHWAVPRFRLKSTQ